MAWTRAWHIAAFAAAACALGLLATTPTTAIPTAPGDGYLLSDLTFVGKMCQPHGLIPDDTVNESLDSVFGESTVLVQGVAAATGANYIAPGSVQRYALSADQTWVLFPGVEDPTGVEGPTGVSDPTLVQLDVDDEPGFFIGHMDSPIAAASGAELLVYTPWIEAITVDDTDDIYSEDYASDGYCVFASADEDGPYTLLGADHFLPFDGNSGGIPLDLDTQFVRLGGTTANYVAVLDWQGDNDLSADFSAGAGPYSSFDTVAFTDRSSQPSWSIDTWAWTFGDGGTSTLRDPTHAYSAPGTYTVCLTIFDEAEYFDIPALVDQLGTPDVVDYTDSICHPITILNLPPTADFDWNAPFLPSFRNVDFTDQSTDLDGTIVSWSWTFDTLGSSILSNPTFEFPAFSTYPVTLTVTDDQGATASHSENTVLTNIHPWLDPLGDARARVGQTLQWRAPWGDPDNHPVTFIATLPAGATIELSTGIVTWKPVEADIGWHNISVALHETYWPIHAAQSNGRIQVLPALQSPWSDIDTDLDGIQDSADNCFDVPNPRQLDADMDGIGNACEDEGAPAGQDERSGSALAGGETQRGCEAAPPSDGACPATRRLANDAPAAASVPVTINSCDECGHADSTKSARFPAAPIFAVLMAAPLAWGLVAVVRRWAR